MAPKDGKATNREHGLGAVLGRGIGTSIRNNYSAYGFSVMITSVFAVVAASRGGPEVEQAFFFAAGAVGGFTAVEAVVSGGFSHRLRGEPSDVVALGTAFSFISVGIGIASGAMIAEPIRAAVAWPAASFLATVLYVTVSGVEIAMAERLKERD